MRLALARGFAETFAKLLIQLLSSGVHVNHRAVSIDQNGSRNSSDSIVGRQWVVPILMSPITLSPITLRSLGAEQSHPWNPLVHQKQVNTFSLVVQAYAHDLESFVMVGVIELQYIGQF